MGRVRGGQRRTIMGQEITELLQIDRPVPPRGLPQWAHGQIGRNMGRGERGERAGVQLAIERIAQGVIVEGGHDAGFLQGVNQSSLS